MMPAWVVLSSMTILDYSVKLFLNTEKRERERHSILSTKKLYHINFDFTRKVSKKYYFYHIN